MRIIIQRAVQGVRRIAATPAMCLLGLFCTAYANDTSAYVIAGSKWGSSVLGTSGGTVTWNFLLDGSNCRDASPCSHVSSIMEVGYEDEIQRAFDTWESVADIQFERVADGGHANIRIGAHEFFWGAHAYYPPWGEIHFSTIFNWVITSGGLPIFPIALHEIGHAMGLEHTDVVETAMAPSTLPGYQFRWQLAPDDIAGIQYIYGPSAHHVPIAGTLWLAVLGWCLLPLRVRGQQAA